MFYKWRFKILFVAASILAKVYHDTYVEELCDKDPDL